MIGSTTNKLMEKGGAAIGLVGGLAFAAGLLGVAYIGSMQISGGAEAAQSLADGVLGDLVKWGSLAGAFAFVGGSTMIAIADSLKKQDEKPNHTIQ